MALRKSAIAVKFAGGIETKADQKTVPTAKLIALENGVFTKAISIVKRNGYESLANTIDGSTATLAGAKRLATRGDELLAFTADRCYSRASDLGAWSDAGAVMSLVGSDKPAVRTGTQQTMPDHATVNGVSVYAWEDSRGGVWWTTVDAITGRVFRAPAQLDAAGQKPRCVATGGALHVYYAVPAQFAIQLAVVNSATPSANVVPQSLVQDLDGANPAYDVDQAGTTTIIAWAERGTGFYRFGYVTVGGLLGSPGNGNPSIYREDASPLSGSLAVSGHRPTNGASIAISFYSSFDGPGVVTIGYTLDTSGPFPVFTKTWGTFPIAISSPTRIANVLLDALDALGGHQAYCIIEQQDAQPSQRLTKVLYVSELNGNGGLSIVRSVGLASRAFQVDGNQFVVVVHDTTYFNTYVTLRLADLLHVGRHVPGGATGAPSRVHLSSVHVDGEVASFCLPHRERLASKNNDKFGETGLRLFTLGFDSIASHQAAQLGRGLYLAGACPQHYDGRAWDEQGFHVGPELIVAVASGGGGAMTGVGLFIYVAWYEWTDAQGEIHRGPTSTGTNVVFDGTQTHVTLTLPTLRLTQKTNVRICVARSELNDETALYRVTSLDPTTAGAAANGYVANDPTIDSVVFVDRLSDLALLGQEPLYTNGGVLSNDPAGLGSVIANGKSRLYWTDPSDENLIRYSQELADGYAVEVAPELSIRCGPFGGQVTALAVMDEQVVIFKEGALFIFGGDGPLANGDTSAQGFSAPQLITSDVGCTNPASIALTPVGLMFQSAKGIYRLDRSRSVTYVGAPVEAFNGQTVRRATVMPDRTQIVFLTDAGKTLLFDHLFGQWSTFTNHEGEDAAIVSGRYHYVRTDGRVFRETPGVFSDAGNAIRLYLETAWVHLHEYLQGFSRFYHLHILGERKSAHTLWVSIETDYVQHWTQPHPLDATVAGGTVYGEGVYGDGPYGGTPPPAYQWRAHLGVKGQGVRFRFYDSSVNPGEGFNLSEILITGGAKGPAAKPFAASRST